MGTDIIQSFEYFLVTYNSRIVFTEINQNLLGILYILPLLSGY